MLVCGCPTKLDQNMLTVALINSTFQLNYKNYIKLHFFNPRLLKNGHCGKSKHRLKAEGHLLSTLPLVHTTLLPSLLGGWSLFNHMAKPVRLVRQDNKQSRQKERMYNASRNQPHHPLQKPLLNRRFYFKIVTSRTEEDR